MLDAQTTKNKNENIFLKGFDMSAALIILLFFSGDIFDYVTYDSRTGQLSIELVQVG